MASFSSFYLSNDLDMNQIIANLFYGRMIFFPR